MARERLLALRYPNDVVDDVAKLVELHLRFHTYRMGWTDSAVRRYVRDAGPLLDDLNELTRCDCTTRNAKKAAALGAPHGRARGAHRRAARAGGAGEDPARARRQRGDEVPRRRARAGSSARRSTSCSRSGSRRARSPRTRPPSGCAPGRANAASSRGRAGLDAFLARPPEDRRSGSPGPGSDDRNGFGLEQHVDAVAGAVQRREHVGDRARPHLDAARRRA